MLNDLAVGPFVFDLMNSALEAKPVGGFALMRLAGEFYEPVVLQPQKPAIVWVAMNFVMRLQKEWFVYFGSHDH
jgi:hypothetical protein